MRNLAMVRARSASLKAFLRLLCHEIRTPLSIVQMSLGKIVEVVPRNDNKERN